MRFLPICFLALFACSALGFAPSTLQAEVTVSKVDTAAPADDLSEEVAATLQKTGYKVADGDKTICEFWLCETWTSTPGFQASPTVLYPIESGTLVGVLRFPEGGSDFRQQQLEAGVYTMRYGRQPQDGNHIGTSDTLDFILLSKAEDDKDTAAMDALALNDQSALAAGSTHPAMMSLRPAPTDLETVPAVQHDEVHDWTSVRVAGTSVAGDKKSSLQLEFVVVGFAAE